MSDQLFGGTRIVQCKACGHPHLAKDMPIGLCRECIEYIVTETPAAKRRAARPSNQDRASWYARAGTSVPGSMRSLPLADRAFVAVLRGLAWVGKIWRKR
jgi:hypothetical protein